MDYLVNLIQYFHGFFNQRETNTQLKIITQTRERLLLKKKWTPQSDTLGRTHTPPMRHAVYLNQN